MNEPTEGVAQDDAIIADAPEDDAPHLSAGDFAPDATDELAAAGGEDQGVTAAAGPHVVIDGGGDDEVPAQDEE